MAKRKLRVFGDPILLRKARPVGQISGTIRKLTEDMFETMYENRGIGLAAPQVGISKRIFVVDTKEMGEKLCILNPKILSSSKNAQDKYKEGCLSLPGIEAEIKRPRRVTLEYTNLDGEREKLSADGLLSRVIQHEYDHVEGILLLDRIESAEEREILLDLMKQIKSGVHI